MTKKTWVIVLSVLIVATLLSGAFGHKIGYRKGTGKGYRIGVEMAPQTRRLHLQNVSTTSLPFNYTRRDYWPQDSQSTNKIKLLDYRIAVVGKNMDFYTFRWQTKVENAHLGIADINYYIEFRNQNGSLLELVGPISHGVNVAVDGGKTITDQGTYRMKSSFAKDFDPARSKMYIRVRW